MKICRTKLLTGGNRTSSSFLYSRDISLSAPVVHALMKLNKLIDFREMVDIEGSLKYNYMNPAI
jgi:hypothetical protein